MSFWWPAERGAQRQSRNRRLNILGEIDDLINHPRSKMTKTFNTTLEPKPKQKCQDDKISLSTLCSMQHICCRLGCEFSVEEREDNFLCTDPARVV